MSDKLAATFHGSGTPTFVTLVGNGPPMGVTLNAADALVELGWRPPPERVPRDDELTWPKGRP